MAIEVNVQLVWAMLIVRTHDITEMHVQLKREFHPYQPVPPTHPQNCSQFLELVGWCVRRVLDTYQRQNRVGALGVHIESVRLQPRRTDD